MLSSDMHCAKLTLAFGSKHHCALSAASRVLFQICFVTLNSKFQTTRYVDFYELITEVVSSISVPLYHIIFTPEFILNVFIHPPKQLLP